MASYPDVWGLFSLCANQAVTGGLKELTSGPVAHADLSSITEDGRSGKPVCAVEVSERMFCSTCQCPFESREEQVARMKGYFRSSYTEDFFGEGSNQSRAVPGMHFAANTEHYKLDWHRFNLKQRLKGRSAVTVEEFEKKTCTGDISSISGSEPDNEDEDEDVAEELVSEEADCTTDSRHTPFLLSAKVVFQNSQGQYLLMYRCVLQSKNDKDEAVFPFLPNPVVASNVSDIQEEDSVSSLRKISNCTVWVILMTGGGHFAGAVFKGKELVQHKTFHRYTVRAKRGSAQGLRDSQNRNHMPKSAGATLRRYNEAALHKEAFPSLISQRKRPVIYNLLLPSHMQIFGCTDTAPISSLERDIGDLLESWTEHLKEASVIFLRAPSYNKNIFFGGRGAPLDKKDQRIRVIPFATRRATFSEVKRVFDLLSTVHVYQKDTEISNVLSPTKKTWKRKTSKLVPVDHSVPKTNVSLETVEITLGTLDLREHEIQPNKKKKRKRKEKGEDSTNRELVAEKEDGENEVGREAEEDSKEIQRKPRNKRKHKTKKCQPEDAEKDSWEFSLRDALYTACKTGDIQSLHALLHLPEDDENQMRCSEVSCVLNKPIDPAGFTLLHVASAAGQKSVIRLLMDAGSDPAMKYVLDKKGQTPYGVAPEKDTRNTFRKYMAEHPEKYDYSKAQVPGPLTEEIESKKAEKKKAQKAARKQKEKDQKEEKQKKLQEEEEKMRFMALSDREKRALAAERRLVQHLATAGGTLSNIRRCFQCGESLLGKIPFEYLEYAFCAPRCVQAHRKANAAARP
ncbi:hypothetical protein DNTS_000108 [Danionella cerebrum]|uniref:VLRF1 domain-containing protein n=1 Tax=Danionella cerebrum TaxID=2873325 RepID=A0A553RBU0_9TELE|nr:hypothetical protein DNTS_000108 [Danionella translucida]